MPLLSGRPVPFGNGSSVALIGVEQQPKNPRRDEDDNEPRYWVYFLANIECREAPPSGNRVQVILNLARAIWILIGLFPGERPNNYLVLPPDGKANWMRLIFRRSIEGKLHQPEKYLSATAQTLENIWQRVRYAEYGHADENKILTPKLEGGCPIRPHDIRLFKRTPKDLPISTPNEVFLYGKDADLPPLGFGSPEADKVATSILNRCHRCGGGWANLHNYGLYQGQSITELLRNTWEIGEKEYYDGLEYLIKRGYLAEGEGSHSHFVRESFVVQFWRASLNLKQVLLPDQN